MSDNPRQKGKTQKHFFCFSFLLLSENNVFWETETWDSSQNHIHEWKSCAFCFLVSGFWYLTLDWLLVFVTNSTTCKAPTESQLFSSSYAAAYIILNRNKKESVSEATTCRTRSSALPPQPTHKVKEFFARHCKSIWSMLSLWAILLFQVLFFFFLFIPRQLCNLIFYFINIFGCFRSGEIIGFKM